MVFLHKNSMLYQVFKQQHIANFNLMMQVVVSLHFIITTAAVLVPVLVILRLDLYFSCISHSDFNLLSPTAFGKV